MSGWLTNGLPQVLPGALTGVEQLPIDTELTGGQSPLSAYINSAAFGLGFQTVAAAGASQGNATAISLPAATVAITVTASTEGVKLPAVSTGARFLLMASPTVGNKVYAAAAGQKIGTATTATTAFVMAANTSTLFVGIDTSHWRVQKGG